MNQHQFLEHLWWSVIDHEDQASANATSLDVRHVARYARYGAVFDWCVAFDEAGLLPAQWLDAEHRPRWEALADAGSLEIPATARRRRSREDGPFADADSAMDRLLASGASRSELASVVDRARRDALSATLGALRAQSFGPDDLAGLHESLLSADPSGMEARPGSWPPKVRPRAARPKSDAPAPLVKLRVSHELAFSPEGSRIVAAAGGVITDLASRGPLATCAVLANTAHVAWSPDGRWIAATSTAGKIALCDAATGAQASRLSCSPDGRWCAVTHGGGFRIGLTADLSHATEVAMQYASNRAAFSPDSRRIALATWNAGEVWEIDRLVRA